jgi:hypothetical protein
VSAEGGSEGHAIKDYVIAVFVRVEVDLAAATFEFADRSMNREFPRSWVRLNPALDQKLLHCRESCAIFWTHPWNEVHRA